MLLLMVAFTVFFFWSGYQRFRSFAYADMDLAAYSQIVWNLSQGSFQSSILGVNFIGHHAHLILILFAPFYRISASPLTLIFLQALFISLVAVPIFLIARDELGEAGAITLSLVYFLYPPLHYVNLFEFHATVFAAAFIGFMALSFLRGWFIPYIVFLGLTLLCQESLPLIVLPFGIFALFFRKKEPVWGITAVVTSLIWFTFTVGWLIPAFNEGKIDFWLLYGHLGAGPREILWSLLRHPGAIIGILVQPEKIRFLAQLFMPLGFLPLLSPMSLVIIPSILQHFLSGRPMEYSIYYHYTIELIPILFIAAVFGLRRIMVPGSFRLRPALLWILLILTGSAAFLRWGPPPKVLFPERNSWHEQMEAFTEKVPERASIVATFGFLPYLTQRPALYSFHHVVHGFYTLSRQRYKLPADVEYALIDFNDLLGFDSFYRYGRSEENICRFFWGRNWIIEKTLNNTVLLKQSEAPGREVLFRIDPPLLEEPKRILLVYDHKLLLRTLDAAAPVSLEKGGRKMSLRLRWQALQKPSSDYWFLMEVTDEKGRIVAETERPLCYRIYPSYLWQPGAVVTEYYNLFIPETAPNAFRVRLTLFDRVTGRRVPGRLSIDWKGTNHAGSKL